MNLSKINVRNEIQINFGTKHEKDIFAEGLWYLFKSPLLSHILLAYLEPGLIALCVKPDTFLSKSLLKLYESELNRYGEN
jgi:hypothetical protein